MSGTTFDPTGPVPPPAASTLSFFPQPTTSRHTPSRTISIPGGRRSFGAVGRPAGRRRKTTVCPTLFLLLMESPPAPPPYSIAPPPSDTTRSGSSTPAAYLGTLSPHPGNP